jgi:tRNA U34 2-thiouridine synthase MnmA/TrmU
VNVPGVATLGLAEPTSNSLYCSIRSADKLGTLIKEVRPISTNSFEIETVEPLMAPATGQAAVIYEKLQDGVWIVKSCGTIVDQ